eukprot:TRINITY_DN9181_c0_g1_i1.p2 TRINITY_DN9181_c0_g1~~TRINITY_DN9181_c0_g1_i1.p2  ORF type:complete len:503 (-),score=103.16 TRINITY_DN9181_c0_g1_i1:778-2286(-)
MMMSMLLASAAQQPCAASLMSPYAEPSSTSMYSPRHFTDSYCATAQSYPFDHDVNYNLGAPLRYMAAELVASSAEKEINLLETEGVAEVQGQGLRIPPGLTPVMMPVPEGDSDDLKDDDLDIGVSSPKGAEAVDERLWRLRRFLDSESSNSGLEVMMLGQESSQQSSRSTRRRSVRMDEDEDEDGLPPLDERDRFRRLEQRLQRLDDEKRQLEQKVAQLQLQKSTSPMDFKAIPPTTYKGDDRAKFSSWAVKTASYLSGLHPDMEILLEAAAKTDDPCANAGLKPEYQQLSKMVYRVLMMLCDDAALELCRSCNKGEGFLVWRLLFREWAPKVPATQVSDLQELLNFQFDDLQGDLPRCLARFDVKRREYEAINNKKIDKDILVGILVRNIKDAGLRRHIVEKTSKAVTWEEARDELFNQCRVLSLILRDQNAALRQAVVEGNSAAEPMEIDSLSKKGKGKGQGKGKDGEGLPQVVCYRCGKPGHLARSCRSKVADETSQNV